MSRAIVVPMSMATLLLLAADLSHGVSDKDQVSQRLERSTAVLEQIASMQEKGIPQEVREKTKCMAVVPSMLMGGLMFGTRPGQGIVTCRTGSGWSAPTFFTLTGGRWGMQYGAQNVDVVMLIMNDKGMRDMLGQTYKIDGSSSTEILAYAHAKGSLSGISLAGARIAPDQNAAIAIYGKQPSTEEVLHGEIKATPESSGFLKAMEQL